MAGIVPNVDLLNSNAPFGLTFVYMFNDTIANIVMAAMVISALALCFAGNSHCLASSKVQQNMVTSLKYSTRVT